MKEEAVKQQNTQRNSLAFRNRLARKASSLGGLMPRGQKKGQPAKQQAEANHPEDKGSVKLAIPVLQKSKKQIDEQSSQKKQEQPTQLTKSAGPVCLSRPIPTEPAEHRQENGTRNRHVLCPFLSPLETEIDKAGKPQNPQLQQDQVINPCPRFHRAKPTCILSPHQSGNGDSFPSSFFPFPNHFHPSNQLRT